MRRIETPPRLAPRPLLAHKASVGTVLVVGGSRDMCGAPALTALGALRAGAGLVRIAVPRSVQGVVATMRPEATTAGLSETRSGSLARPAVATVARMAESWDAVVLGPGAGRATATQGALRDLAAGIARPLVLDADALFALASDPGKLAKRSAATVVTPHEGEAARLLATRSADVRAGRESAALELVGKTGAIVVLKGPGTIVTDGDRMFTCGRGGPWLASGGTGDVLAGVVGAFLAGLPATGGDAFGAACAAVDVHAAAGDAWARDVDRGLLASDLAHALPRALAGRVGKGRANRKTTR